jgi:hypothetical protein
MFAANMSARALALTSSNHDQFVSRHFVKLNLLPATNGEA